MANLNPEGAFSSLKDRVKAAITQQFPYVGKKHRLELVSVEIKDDGGNALSPYHIDNIQSQYASKVAGGTWAVPIRAELRLVDIATGKALDTSAITLARLPKITRRYSYIVDGHERQHDSVFRLKARPYHDVADNGVIRAHWNVSKGHGFELHADPQNGALMMKLGTSNIPMYPILHALGVSDDKMERSWGAEVLRINKKKAKPGDILKVVKVLGHAEKTAKPPTLAEAEEFVRTAFAATKLREDAMIAAFGKPYDHVNGENLLLSTNRLVGIMRGTEEVDDKQSLANKDLAGTEDFIVEAIEKKTGELRRRVLANIDRQTEIGKILAPNSYTKVIRGVFQNAQFPDQNNPLGYISGYTRTTLLGADYGGIKGEHTNLDRDQLISPSHLGFLDPIHTPEAGAGIAVNLPLGVRKEGKDIFISAYSTAEKKMVQVTPLMLERAVVAYPDQAHWTAGVPTPVSSEVVVYDSDQKTTKRPWKDVQYVLRSPKGLFSFSTNLIPFLQNTNGNRAMMAAKQQEQAIALTHREQPLVQVKSESAMTFENILGAFNSHHSPVAGKVTKVTPNEIHIKGGDKTAVVQLYNHFPLNGGKMMLHSTPSVKVGDSVEKGKLLADSNYSKDGVLALGTNMRVAYVPYGGVTFEDGVVLSESAAKKLTSEHLHVETATIYPGMILGKKRWADYAVPERASGPRLAKLSDDGVIREGQEVHYGDVLMAILSPSPKTREDQELANIHKSLVKDFKDRAVIWEHDYPGKVVRVINDGKNIAVHIKTAEAMVIGDKLTARHGNKGIVSAIIPDHEMPKDKSGHQVEILLNPAGVPSRINIGQVLETAASKVARKTGKPYVIENFQPNVDYSQKVKEDLKHHGLSDTEELFDGKTGKSLGQIMTGDQYMLKLHHVVDKKMTARSYGGGYSSTGQAPSGSGIPGGGQKMDQLAIYAMLAHGAHANLREAETYKGDQDQGEVWAAVQAGRPLPAPQPSRGVSMLTDYMKGMGIHSEKKGDKYVLSPMTDKQTAKVSNGVIKFPDKALMAKGLRTIEEAGGLFDVKITGGMEGKFWSHMELPKRVPNPVFEKAIAVVTGMKQKEIDDLVGPAGVVNGRSGFDVLADRLKAVDVDKELAKTEKSLASLKGPALNAAYNKVRYLRNLKTLNITPLDAYTNAILPVVPPATRKVSIGLDGKQIFDDLNGLYRAVGQATDQINKAPKATPPSEMQKMYAHMYDAVRALRMSGSDMGEIGKTRHHFGLMEKMTGTSPKESFFQSKVITRRQDLSGRSTIIPAPDLGLDEVGIPLPMALEMYKPFVVKELYHSRGVTPLKGQLLVQKKDPAAIEALHRVIADRPLLLKRDPALHKFSVLAFNPRLTSGKAIGLHPMVCAGYNADFDGDQMGAFVPVSQEAVDEARLKMRPSQNLFSPTHGGLMNLPTNEALVGLYKMTEWGKEAKLPADATTENRVIELMRAGKLAPTDVITWQGHKTTAGRLLLAQQLPADTSKESLLHDPAFRVAKSSLNSIMTGVARTHEAEFPHVVGAWKHIGDEFAYKMGVSFSLNDFHDGTKFRDEILAKPKAEEDKIRASRSLTQKEKDQKIVELYTEAQATLKKAGEERYSKSGNKMYDWVKSGGKGNWAQFSQMTLAPIMVVDSKSRPVPVPITKSFGEGLPVAQYWASMHGARKGAIDRSKSTEAPGAMTKVIVNTIIDQRITKDDCGTDKGVAADPSDPLSDVVDRYLAKDVELKNGEKILARTLLTPPVLTRIKNAGVHKIVVRSPLHCQQASGICSICYGHNVSGKLYTPGTNIGAIVGNALGEPVTQLAMKTFHEGGVIGKNAAATNAFKRAEQLFLVPQTLPDSATLAETSGTVTAVAPNKALGGHDVVIDGVTHRIPAQLAPLDTVHVGAPVTKGDALSTGPINPHHLLGLTKNMHAVRGYLVSELLKIYPSGAKRRNFETAVRAMTNLTRIEHAPGHPEYDRGQKAPLSEIEFKNRQAAQNGLPQIAHTPLLQSMEMSPLEAREDWIGRLNFRRLEDTMTEGAAQGWASDIHGSTIAGLMHGAEFGTKPMRDVDHTPYTSPLGKNDPF